MLVEPCRNCDRIWSHKWGKKTEYLSTCSFCFYVKTNLQIFTSFQQLQHFGLLIFVQELANKNKNKVSN